MVLVTVITATLTRVETVAGTILLTHRAHVDDVACIAGVAVMDVWGLWCGLVLSIMDRGILLTWCCRCSLAWFGLTPSRCRAFYLLNDSAHKEGMQIHMSSLSLCG